MAFLFGGVQRIQIQNTYCATLPVRLAVCWIWLLLYLYRNVLNPWDMINSFYLDTPECSQTWCGHTVQCTQTGYDASRQISTLHSWVYDSWRSPEWTTVCHLKLHNTKIFRSSLAMLGYHSGRWRRTLFLRRNNAHIWKTLMVCRLRWAICILQTKNVKF